MIRGSCAPCSPGGGQKVAVVVHVHCYLHRESLGLTPDAYTKQQAPQYFLKLLAPEAISMVGPAALSSADMLCTSTA